MRFPLAINEGPLLKPETRGLTPNVTAADTPSLTMRSAEVFAK